MTSYFGFNTRGTLSVNSIPDFFDGGSGGDNLVQSYPLSIDLPFAQSIMGAYIEDDWRAKPNFTLTAALRVEHYSNLVCQSDCFARLNGTFFGVTHDPNEPLNEAILSSQHQAVRSVVPVTWSPAIGFFLAAFFRAVQSRTARRSWHFL